MIENGGGRGGRGQEKENVPVLLDTQIPVFLDHYCPYSTGGISIESRFPVKDF